MVEWKKIGNVCTVMTPPKKLKKECYQKEGLYPIIDQGQSDIVGYTDDEESLLASDSYVLFGDHTRYVKYINGKFAQGADGLKILKCDRFLNPKFFYYTFSNTSIPTRGYSRHWSIAKEIEIPIPSLSEQNRIVGILDTFTESIENLRKQISERKKQYEYYRDQLLFCTEINATIHDVASFGKGRISSINLNEYNYVSVENLLKDKAGKAKSTKIPEWGFWSKFLKNDILIGNIRPYLRKIWFADIEGGTNGDVVIIRPNLNEVIPRFLFNVLSSERFFIFYNQTAKGGKMPRGEKSRILKFAFFLPDRFQQSRIVSILDTFEASITNLEQQLSYRQKQYEYYRNMLLTFDE